MALIPCRENTESPSNLRFQLSAFRLCCVPQAVFNNSSFPHHFQVQSKSNDEIRVAQTCRESIILGIYKTIKADRPPSCYRSPMPTASLTLDACVYFQDFFVRRTLSHLRNGRKGLNVNQRTRIVGRLKARQGDRCKGVDNFIPFLSYQSTFYKPFCILPFCA